MRTYTKGHREIVERMQGESIKFYGMAGDGCTAPGCVVIRALPHNTMHPFAVHFGNTQDGGYYFGNYCKDMQDAESAFAEKIGRYDRDGELHRHFTRLGL